MSLNYKLMKVPFEEVPELVASRRVFLHRGYAYVAMNQVNVNAYSPPMHFTSATQECTNLIVASDLIFIGSFPCCPTFS